MNKGTMLYIPVSLTVESNNELSITSIKISSGQGEGVVLSV